MLAHSARELFFLGLAHVECDLGHLGQSTVAQFLGWQGSQLGLRRVKLGLALDLWVQVLDIVAVKVVLEVLFITRSRALDFIELATCQALEGLRLGLGPVDRFLVVIGRRVLVLLFVEVCLSSCLVHFRVVFAGMI